MGVSNQAVIWSMHEYANGVIIKIHNPYSITLNTEAIEHLIALFIPAHVKYYIQYV